MRAYAQKPLPDTVALDFAIAGIVPGQRVQAKAAGKCITGKCIAVYPKYALVETDAGYRTTVALWHLFGVQDEEKEDKAEKAPPKRKRKRRTGK